MSGVCMTRSTVTLFEIPLLSIVSVFTWTLIRRNGSTVCDWSLLYPFFAIILVVKSDVAGCGGISRLLKLPSVQVGDSCTGRLYSSL